VRRCATEGGAPYAEEVRRRLLGATAVTAGVALCGCDAAELFGLQRGPDARLDTPVPIDAATDAAIDAPSDARSDASIDAPIDAPPGPVCPASYGVVDVTLPNRYRFITTARSWIGAQNDCTADQIAGSTRFTHLAVINDEPERSRLNAFSPMRTWVGASDRKTEAAYLWVTNEAGAQVLPQTGSPWANNEPDHANPDDDCVEMGATADYAESDCGALLPAWCECDASPVVTSNY
jgi:hypothetical protein